MEKETRTVIYARVSSIDQRSDLERQIQFLTQYSMAKGYKVVAVLIDGLAYIFETDTGKTILGYYYRRKKIQKKYDKQYGVRSRVKRRALRKPREKYKKRDAKWKIANIIVRATYERGYGIVL